MCMGFTAVTKRSGIDGQNEEDLYFFKAISHCYSYESMCMGFTAVTKRSGIDGQNQEDWISRRRRSKWLKGKKISLHLIADVNVTSCASNSTAIVFILWTPLFGRFAQSTARLTPWDPHIAATRREGSGSIICNCLALFCRFKVHEFTMFHMLCDLQLFWMNDRTGFCFASEKCCLACQVQTLQPEAAAVEACNSPWNSCPSRLKTWSRLQVKASIEEDDDGLGEWGRSQQTGKWDGRFTLALSLLWFRLSGTGQR